MCPIGENDARFHARALRQDTLEQTHEHDVGEHELILGVIEDVDELLLEQPRIDRVADASAARNGVVQLHVSVIVPRERRDPRIAAGAEAIERIREPPRTGKAIREGVPVTRIVPGDRYDFTARVIALGVSHDRRDRQRYVHHQAVHLSLPILVPSPPGPGRAWILPCKPRIAREPHA